MSDHLPRRLGGHLSRHSIAYAVGVFALSFSPVPSMAADLVTTADIANGAVTTPKLAADSVVTGKIDNETIQGTDIRNGTVRDADLAESAKGAKVIRYDLGSHDFEEDGSFHPSLPGSWTGDTVTRSSWSVVMYRDYGHHTGNDYGFVIPGHADGSEYGLYVSGWGLVEIWRIAGPGEDYEKIFLYRTVTTSTVDVP